MSSIMTNAAAMTALQSLNATSKGLQTTQNRISTGYRVAEASDNAAYWSIATTMRSDNKVNSVVQDALGLGSGKVDTAYTAMNQAIDVVDKIKQKVLLAKTGGPEDRAKIQSEIDTYVRPAQGQRQWCQLCRDQPAEDQLVVDNHRVEHRFVLWPQRQRRRMDGHD